jgi:hypothetical protein
VRAAPIERRRHLRPAGDDGRLLAADEEGLCTVNDGFAAVDVDLPAPTAWRAVTAWDQQGRWMPLTTVDVISGDGGLGTRLRARTGFGPLAVVDDMVIDVYDAPRRAEVQHLGRIVTGRGIFMVAALPGNRSRVTWIERPAPHSAVGRLGPLAGAPTGAVLRIALRRFQRIAATLG